MGLFDPLCGLGDYDLLNDEQALLELNRERDAGEIQLAIITSWPFDAQLGYLRDSLRARIAKTETMLARSYAVLDTEGLGRKNNALDGWSRSHSMP